MNSQNSTLIHSISARSFGSSAAARVSLWARILAVEAGKHGKTMKRKNFYIDLINAAPELSCALGNYVDWPAAR